jgi:hypothetical protein
MKNNNKLKNFVSNTWAFVSSGKNSSFMKTLLIIGLIIALLLTMQKCHKSQCERESLEKVGKLKDQKIKYWKDANDREHATVEEIKASRDVIKYYFQAQLDSVSKILGIKEKQIQEFDKIAFVASGGGTGKIVTKDSIVYVRDPNDYNTIVATDTITSQIHPRDGYLSFDAYMKTNGKYDYDYTYTDELVRVTHYEKYGFLKMKKRTIIDFSLKNPNSHVTGVTQFKIDQQKPKKWGLGPFVGYGWTGKGFGITAGISLQYNIIRF